MAIQAENDDNPLGALFSDKPECHPAFLGGVQHADWSLHPHGLCKDSCAGWFQSNLEVWSLLYLI